MSKLIVTFVCRTNYGYNQLPNATGSLWLQFMHLLQVFIFFLQINDLNVYEHFNR